MRCVLSSSSLHQQALSIITVLLLGKVLLMYVYRLSSKRDINTKKKYTLHTATDFAVNTTAH